MATDVSTCRLDAALRFGADYAFPAAQDIPARFRDKNSGLGADLIIVCAGATGAIDQALKTVERGGTILLFAADHGGSYHTAFSK